MIQNDTSSITNLNLKYINEHYKIIFFFVILGMQPVDSEFETFIGVVTQRGVSYTTKSVATGLGAMLFNQVLLFCNQI